MQIRYGSHGREKQGKSHFGQNDLSPISECQRDLE